jgi:hypothetical protein
MQDTRKNKFTGETELRYYAQFMQANYGFIPQTWEEDYKTDEKGLKVFVFMSCRAIMTPWIWSNWGAQVWILAFAFMGRCWGRSV